METHFFLVTSSTCATYLWSNMAVQAPVITSSFQLVRQKIILPFGSDISPLLKFHRLKYLPWSWQNWGWVHRRAGECDPTTEHWWWVTRATTLHSCPCNLLLFGSPTQLSACFGLQIWIWMRLEERKWPRLYKYGENKKRKKIRNYKNAKSIGKYAYNRNFAVIKFRYTCGWWINL